MTWLGCDDRAAAVGEILEIDASKREVRLSTKALMPPAYEGFKASHTRGQVVYAKVVRTIQSFVFVKLAGGADGKIHVSDLATARVGHPDEIVNDRPDHQRWPSSISRTTLAR